MVNETTTFINAHGKSYKISQTLTCKDYGIYMLQCCECLTSKRRPIGTYIGQTTTSFSIRFGGHRNCWKEAKKDLAKLRNPGDKNDDRYAIAMHMVKTHGYKSLPELEECYDVTFLCRPAPKDLDVYEDKYKHRMKANINVNKMVTANIH